MTNRSVPANVILPHVTYQNVAAAVDWLSKAFGFVEHYRYGVSPDGLQGAQLRLGEAWIMVNCARAGRSSPAGAGLSTQSLTVFVEDVEGHAKRAREAGAKIVEEPHVTEYGEMQYAAFDLEGHHWLFSRHARDVAPEDWGAVTARA
jgi:uncharacterized glyoxalase superfamily protein PhnB